MEFITITTLTLLALTGQLEPLVAPEPVYYDFGQCEPYYIAFEPCYWTVTGYNSTCYSYIKYYPCMKEART